MRGGRSRLRVLVAVVLLLATGGGGPGPGATAAPAAPSECKAAEPRPDPTDPGPLTLVLSQAVARPGEKLTMTVKSLQAGARATRGIDSYLECWNGTEWITRFLLVSDTSGDGGARAWPYPPEPNLSIPSIGFPGEKPEPVQLPDTLRPGWYRIRKTVSLDGVPRYTPLTLYARLKVIR